MLLFKKCFSICLILIASVFVLSCSEAESSCRESVTILESSEIVAASSKLSGKQVLTLVGDAHHWRSSFTDDDEILTQYPQSLQTGLSILITYEDGEIRDVNSTQTASDDDLFGVCRPRIEMDVKVTVETDNGSFAEQWDAVLSYAAHETNPTTELVAQFDPAELRGSYNVVSFNSPENPQNVVGEFHSIISQSHAEGEIEIIVGVADKGADEVEPAVHTALIW